MDESLTHMQACSKRTLMLPPDYGQIYNGNLFHISRLNTCRQNECLHHDTATYEENIFVHIIYYIYSNESHKTYCESLLINVQK